MAKPDFSNPKNPDGPATAPVKVPVKVNQPGK